MRINQFNNAILHKWICTILYNNRLGQRIGIDKPQHDDLTTLPYPLVPLGKKGERRGGLDEEIINCVSVLLRLGKENECMSRLVGKRRNEGGRREGEI